MSIYKDEKLKNIELIDENSTINHNSSTGTGTFTIDSENGTIQLGHTGVNINLIGNINVEGNLYNIIDLTGPTGIAGINGDPAHTGELVILVQLVQLVIQEILAQRGIQEPQFQQEQLDQLVP